MMKHDYIERLIQKSLDRQTNAEEEEKLHRHLARCAACRVFYEEMAGVAQSLGMLVEYYPQPGFNDKIMKALGYGKTRVWRRVAAACTGAWVVSIMALLASPLPGLLFNKTLVSIPAVMRVIGKLELVCAAFSHTFVPFAKGLFNPLYPIAGLVVSVLCIYFLNKTVHKEVTCKVL